eukprot:2148257-Rhodomonas_salina.1
MNVHERGGGQFADVTVQNLHVPSGSEARVTGEAYYSPRLSLSQSLASPCEYKYYRVAITASLASSDSL